MILKIPEACDLFPYADAVPLNCILRLTSKESINGVDRIRIRHECGDGSAECTYTVPRGESKDIVLPIPAMPFCEESELVVELFVKGQLVSSESVLIKGFDEARIPIRSDLSQDSIYVRTMPGSPMVDVGDFFKDLGEKAIYHDRSKVLTLSEAEEYLRLFKRYFDQFEVLPQEIDSGYAKVSGIIDSMYDRKGSTYTLGIVYLGLASRLGLDGIACMSDGRCFVGLSLGDLVPEMSHPLFWNIQTIDTAVDYPFPNMSLNKFLLMEIATDMSFEDSVESASGYCSSVVDWDGKCRCSTVEKKIAEIERSTGSKKRVEADE